RDGVGRLEAYPTTPDAATTVAAYLLSGTVSDAAGQPIAGANVTISPATPALAQTTTEAVGRYVQGIAATGTYSVAADRAGFGQPFVRHLAISNDRTNTALFLPPADNVIANSSFETGSLAGWQAGGANLSSTAFSGDWAARLGPATTAHLSQTVYVPAELVNPTLSFIYQPDGPATFPDALHLRIAGTNQIIPLNVSGWTHEHLDLTSLALLGRPVTISFDFEPAGTSSFAVLLDDIWLGSVPDPPQYSYLPLLMAPLVAASNSVDRTRFRLPPVMGVAGELTPRGYLPIIRTGKSSDVPTPAPTATATATSVPPTATLTPTATASSTATATATPTATASPTATGIPPTVTPTATATATPTATPTAT
ncbi:MAG: carboxypeptidase regulatory-like domain-containing protein, partial [Chloroflexi bacterium]|nr:carboxypeptidase regulatory-like domain-containing protein [Chloroflexota bacterium]